MYLGVYFSYRQPIYTTKNTHPVHRSFQDNDHFHRVTLRVDVTRLDSTVELRFGRERVSGGAHRLRYRSTRAFKHILSV